MPRTFDFCIANGGLILRRAISFGEVKHRQHPAMAGKAGDGADARCSVAAPLPLDCGQPVNSQDWRGQSLVTNAISFGALPARRPKRKAQPKRGFEV